MVSFEITDVVFMDQTEVIFQGAYSYRKMSVGIVSVVMVCIFVPVFVLVAVSFFSTPVTLEIVATFLLAGGISGGMGFVGCWLLHAYLTRRRLELCITREGVSYGGKHFPWSDVGSLSARYHQAGTCQLLLHRQGWIAVDRHLPTDQGLTLEQYENLMTELQQKVAGVHNHLEFA